MYDRFLTELTELSEKRKTRVVSDKLKQMQGLNKAVQLIDHIKLNREEARLTQDYQQLKHSQITQDKLRQQALVKERRKIIEDENHKQQLFNLNKWDLIRAKREAMLKTLKELQQRHHSKRLMSIHVVLNRAVRKAHSDFVALKEHKEREKRRLFAIMLVSSIFRAKMKMRGGNKEERGRRKVRDCLNLGALAKIDNF